MTGVPAAKDARVCERCGCSYLPEHEDAHKRLYCIADNTSEWGARKDGSERWKPEREAFLQRLRGSIVLAINGHPITAADAWDILREWDRATGTTGDIPNVSGRDV